MTPSPETPVEQAQGAGHGPAAPAEEATLHTRLLRLALGVEDSRAYWANVDLTVPAGPRAAQAFEQSWFGAKSMARVRTLLANFAARYDAFPEALAVLRRWREMEPPTRQLICHWHLQLADPLYRRFTSELLPERRSDPSATLDRTAVMQWVKQEYPDRWADATCVQFAIKLLAAVSEAGLVTARRDPRKLLEPKVPDLALAYLLHLLRGLTFSGTLTDNPYLISVGLKGDALMQRLGALRGVTVDENGKLQWEHPTLTAWADATL